MPGEDDLPAAEARLAPSRLNLAAQRPMGYAEEYLRAKARQAPGGQSGHN
jgi:hypothetical protein